MTISRLTLPENFIDWQSAQLLVQPEPQYLFAQFFLSAIGASLPTVGGLGLDGRQVPTQGVGYSAAERDRLALADALPQSLFALGIDFKAKPGNTVRVNRPAFADTTYTSASRRIGTSQTISTVPITIGSEQTHLVLERYAGPYDQANSRVAPFAIESFDAQMGIHAETSIVNTNLRRDFHKFLDQTCVTLGSLGSAIYPDGMTADNDATSVNSYPMTVEQLSRTEQLMDEASLPKLPDGKRILVITPLQWKQLKHDPEFSVNSTFHKEFNILFANYQGTVGGFHTFTSSTLQKVNNSSSVPVQYGMAMCPGGFMSGMGRPPSIRTSTDDNYAETVKVIWLADLAFGLSDNRFFYSVRSA